MRDKLTLIFKPSRLLRFLSILVAIPVFIAISGQAFAQEKVQVTGTVVDGTSGEPLPGVSIMVKGTSVGTVTSVDGTYSIEALSTDILVFSFIGFLDEELLVGSNTVLNVNMVQDIIGLDEVIVTGYGVTRKSDLTGAVSSVSGEDLASIPAMGVDQALQGRAAGVSITSNTGLPGGSVSIAIRGISSINGTQPLVIVDGVRGSLNNLNPADIESVEVLKDASSAAIYGSTGGNGVILVTTKKGKAGEIKSSFNMYMGYQYPWKTMDVMNSGQYAEIHNILNVMQNRDPFSLQSDTLLDINYQDEMFRWAKMQNYDFSVSGGNEVSTFYLSADYTDQQGILQKTDYQRFSLRINSEHKLNKYIRIGENVSFSQSKREGFQEWMFQNAYNSPFTNILRMVPYLPPYTTRYDETYQGDNYADLYAENPELYEFPLSQSTVNPVFYNESGDPDDDQKWSYHPNSLNPQRDVDLVDYFSRNNTVGGNFFLDITPFKGLVITSKFNAYNSIDNSETYNRVQFYNVNNYNTDDDLSKGIGQQHGWEFQEYANYNFSIADNFNFGLMAGFESHYTKRVDFDLYREQLINSTPEMRYLSTSTNDTSLLQLPDETAWESAEYSYFGRLNFDYRSKYLLTVSVRKDYSSRFGPEFRSGVFPSFSAAWKFSEESFIKDLGVFSFGKLRLGYGETGANAPANYAYYARVNSTQGGFTYPISAGNTPAQGAALAQIPNRQMHWETMTMANVGIDLGFFQNRLNITADWFVKQSEGMLLYLTPPSTAGIYQWPGSTEHATSTGGDSRPIVNLGTVRNSGFEITIGHKHSFGDLQISNDLNFTYQKNKVIDMGDNDSITDGAVGVSLAQICLTAEGNPMAQFYGFQTDGLYTMDDVMVDENGEPIVDNRGRYTTFHFNSAGDTIFQSGAQPGDFKFVDVNNDGVIDALDRTVIGNPIPKFILGYSFTAAYKGFDLLLFLEGKFGHQLFNGAKLSNMSQAPGYNRLSLVLDQYRNSDIYWTDENDNEILIASANTDTDQPRLDPTNANQNFRVSDYFVEPGWYLRLKNIQLGYTLPVSLTQHVGVDRLRIYIGARNLLTFTEYSGWDPEFDMSPTVDYASGRKNMMIQGIDITGNYPQNIMYMAGINLNF
jgi:TonB-dependent starch-binding outer membrane protein SusC